MSCRASEGVEFLTYLTAGLDGEGDRRGVSEVKDEKGVCDCVPLLERLHQEPNPFDCFQIDVPIRPSHGDWGFFIVPPVPDVPYGDETIVTLDRWEAGELVFPIPVVARRGETKSKRV